MTRPATPPGQRAIFAPGPCPAHPLRNPLQINGSRGCAFGGVEGGASLKSGLKPRRFLRRQRSPHDAPGVVGGPGGRLVVPALLPAFYVTLFGYVGLATLVALGLVLLTGISGQTSFGQATFVGLAAYATTLLTRYEGAAAHRGSRWPVFW